MVPAVKGYMTFAGDMALMRHEKFVKHVEELCNSVNLPILLIAEYSIQKESRIVDKLGFTVAEYEHKS